MILNSRAILILSVYLILSGCGGSEDEIGEFTISTGEVARHIIPNKTTSCLGERQGSVPLPLDVSSDYVRLPPFTFSWTGQTHDLTIVLVKATFKSSLLSGGTFTCLATDQELAALNETWYAGKKAVMSAYVPSPTALATTLTTDCDLPCGGINIPEGMMGLITGKLEAIAVAKHKVTLEEVALRSETTVQIQRNF